MKYYSEISKKFYDSEKDCLNEETKIIAERAAKEEKKKRLAEEKEARKKELDDALDNFTELLKKYSEDYGPYIRTSGYDYFGF